MLAINVLVLNSCAIVYQKSGGYKMFLLAPFIASNISFNFILGAAQFAFYLVKCTCAQAKKSFLERLFLLTVVQRKKMPAHHEARLKGFDEGLQLKLSFLHRAGTSVDCR